MDVELVQYFDHWYDYEYGGDRQPEYVITLTGFNIGEDDRVLSLAQEILPDDRGYRAVTHIYKVLIVPGSRQVLMPDADDSRDVRVRPLHDA